MLRGEFRSHQLLIQHFHALVVLLLADLPLGERCIEVFLLLVEVLVRGGDGYRHFGLGKLYGQVQFLLTALFNELQAVNNDLPRRLDDDFTGIFHLLGCLLLAWGVAAFIGGGGDDCS